MFFCERTPLGAALHTSLVGVFAETDVCVGEIACNDIDVHFKSLSLCPFWLLRPGQRFSATEAFFCEPTLLKEASTANTQRSLSGD